MKPIIIIVVLIILILVILMAVARSRPQRYHHRRGRTNHHQLDSKSNSESSASYSSDPDSSSSLSNSSSPRRFRRDRKESCCRPIYIVPLFSPGINGVNIQLQVTGGTRPYTYQWLSGETTSNLVNVPYFSNLFVKVLDSNLCENELEFNTPGSPNTVPGCPESIHAVQKARLFSKNI